MSLWKKLVYIYFQENPYQAQVSHKQDQAGKIKSHNQEEVQMPLWVELYMLHSRQDVVLINFGLIAAMKSQTLKELQLFLEHLLYKIF